MEENFFKIPGFTLQHLIGFLISTGIGLLIGLERQFTKEVKENEEQLAGMRTYTMICVLGYLSAFLSAHFGAWLLAVVLGGLFLFVIISYYQISHSPGNRGGTSEIAIIITFLLGTLVFLKFILFALMIMVLLVVLLVFKPGLHSFAKKLTSGELRAIILFVIMSALVIPFLPDANFGPYNLWNLKEIWKMVLLVSGTSLVGYMIAKILGDKGTFLAGLIGGLVSSTSVALTFSRRSKLTKSAASSFFYAMGIISACTIMFPRILFEVYIVNRTLAQQLWLPVILVSIAGFGAAYLIYKLKKGKTDAEALPLKNPLDFATAIKFALFFAGIQWLVKFAGEKFGDSGTYIAGAIAGITDVDAITLSMAKIGTGEQSALAINTILLAALSNTLVKFIIVMTIGSVELRKAAFIGFCAIFFTGLAYFIYNVIM